MTTTTAPTLGALIRQVRTDRGLTQVQVSVRTGIGQTEISGYELNKAVPSLPTLAKYAEGLRLSPAELTALVTAVTR